MVSEVSPLSVASQRGLLPPGLTIGIVGHRPGRITDSAQVGETLRGLFTDLINSLGFEDRQQLRLVSALAEGADRIAAHVALDTQLRLDAILPFPADDYLTDFETEGSRASFHALLAKAESVLTLDGAAGNRSRAYDAAGVAILDNCDLLVAVWDGEAGRGRGGTRDVIDKAVRRGLPIVTITPDGAQAELRVPNPTQRDANHLDDFAIEDVARLPAIVRRIVQVNERGAPDWFGSTQSSEPGWVYAAYPLLLRLAGVGRKRRSRVGDEPEIPSTTDPALQSFFEWWDNMANGAAKAFRSAVIVNFALAALAVVLAASSLLAGDAKWIFVAAEIVTICLLMTNTWHARKRKWQERWLESREIAELLRVTILLRKVGIGRGFLDSAEASWSNRYVSSLARSTPARTVDLSCPQSLAQEVISEITDQAGWNEANAKKMHLVSHRIEKFGEILFFGVLLVAIAWLALWFGEPKLASDLKLALTAITAGLPAIASASYGIRVILDFDGIANRSRQLAGALHCALDGWESSPPSAARLQALVGSSAHAMLGDLNSWRMLTEGRRLAVPG